MAEEVTGGFAQGPTVAALGTVAFKPDQLYVLNGGPDYLRFMVPERLVPFSNVGEPRTINRMRQRMAFSLQREGAVDANGNPCPALASLMAPVRDCAFAVADGLMPDLDEDQSEERSFVTYFGADTATLARSSSRLLGGDTFNLYGLGGPQGWEGAFAQASGLGSMFRLAGTPLYVRCRNDDEKGMLAGLRGGSVDAAEALAEAHGLDPSMQAMLADVADGIDRERYQVIPMQGVDYRQTKLEGMDQARDLRVGPQPWVFSFVVPEVGVIMRSVYVPNPDPDLSVWDEHRTQYSYMDIEFVAGGSVLERLSGVPAAEWGGRKTIDRSTAVADPAR